MPEGPTPGRTLVIPYVARPFARSGRGGLASRPRVAVTRAVRARLVARRARDRVVAVVAGVRRVAIRPRHALGLGRDVLARRRRIRAGHAGRAILVAPAPALRRRVTVVGAVAALDARAGGHVAVAAGGAVGVVG